MSNENINVVKMHDGTVSGDFYYHESARAIELYPYTEEIRYRVNSDNDGVIGAQYTCSDDKWVDAGIDLFCMEDIVIPPNSMVKIDTGVSFDLPPYSVGILYPKSRNDHILGAQVIDCGYTGNIIVKAINPYSDTEIRIRANSGIAQMIVMPLSFHPIRLTRLDVSISKDSARGDKGGIVGNPLT